MGFSLVTAGMLMMVLQGFGMNCQLVTGKILQDKRLPYFRILCLTTFVAAPLMIFQLWRTKAAFPVGRVWKWLFLRGVFGCLNFVLLVLAIRAGASAGDVASLASVNTVCAALFGFVFLKERVSAWHGVSLACCIVGTALVSQPEFIFGTPRETTDGQALWKAYVLAILGGVAQAGIAISSRKTGTTPIMYLTSVTSVVSSVVMWLATATPLLEDYTMDCFLEAPWETFGWFMLLMLQACITVVSSSAGSQWCPAAVSATIGTAARMFWGYLAQVIIFGQPIELLTVLGAILMLAGVVIMALVRAPPQAAKPAAKDDSLAVDEVGLKGMTSSSSIESAPNAEESESIASFIATEFAVLSPHSVHLEGASPVRHRHRSEDPQANLSTAAQHAAQRIGASA